MSDFIDYLIGCHRFFVKETPEYIGVKRNGRIYIEFKDKLYYPIAYF